MTRPATGTWGVVALVLAGAVGFALVARGRSPGPGPEGSAPNHGGAAAIVMPQTSDLLPMPLGDLGDFACVERSGRSMRTSDLRGRLVVADFIFTSCAGPCPLMTEQMARLQAATKAMSDVRLVTVSVDPDRDSPEVLSGYARRAGADPERWLFLRCDRPALVDILCDRFKLVADREDLLLHSSRFVLMDVAGRGRAFYMPLEDDRWLEKLLQDLAVLRGESAR